MPDACSDGTTQLLVNPSFDLVPAGMGWTQAPFDSMAHLITDQGPAAPTAPYKAWLGGSPSSLDRLSQDVVLPVGTTMVTVTGSYLVDTHSVFPTGADFTAIELLHGGLAFASVRTFDDTMDTGQWESFSNSVPISTQTGTIQLRFTAQADGGATTDFLFDSLELTATYCQ